MSTVVGLTLVIAAIAAAAWVAVGLFLTPDVRPVRFSPEDGVRAQRKLLDLARQRPRASAVITEAELNAFVTRHLDPADLPVADPVIRLPGQDIVEITGTVTLGRLLHNLPLGWLTETLPTAWQARPVWLSIRAGVRVTTESRRVLRLDPQRVAIGRQRIPAFVLRLVVDPAALRLMRIALPADVETVRVDRGRVIIEKTSPPPRT